MTIEQELADLEQKLSDPEFVKDYRQVGVAAKRMAEIQRLLDPTINDKRSTINDELIVEIRAGTGGEEAALFAGELYNMYSLYAATKGWSVKTVDKNETSLGGFKQVVFEIAGSGAYKALAHESGVHRVQRIPKTEKAGRVHTSTASVAILPIVEAKEVQVNPNDLEVGKILIIPR